MDIIEQQVERILMTEKHAETIIDIDHVSKEYTLGAIGGTTLRAELQRKLAKIRRREDPTKKIGQRTVISGEKFWALKDVSFQVKKGEAVGIIGHNGAGKSTLLKLLCRVTAPTEGSIGYNGRIASMLEVGTGFHPELTGRENVYMNGAILGMTRKEISEKMDEIVEFSEVGEFIDTPVKRYSSGMYVKLAFSVAAHLDADIMIMDEVLAVGDMRFQQKCLTKMRESSSDEGKTVLYVSHNMNTIRQLCDRCVVLDHGRLIFDGDVNEAISYYYGIHASTFGTFYDLHDKNRVNDSSHQITFDSLEIKDKSENIFQRGEKIKLRIKYRAEANIFNARVLILVEDDSGLLIGTMASLELKKEKFSEGEHEIDLEIATDNFGDGRYYFNIELSEFTDTGACHALGHAVRAFNAEITSSWNEKNHVNWNRSWYGDVVFPELMVH